MGAIAGRNRTEGGGFSALTRRLGAGCLVLSGLVGLALAAPAGAAFTTVATIAVGGTPDGAAIDLSNHLVYVGDNDDAITEITGSTVTGGLSIVGQIEGAAVNESLHEADFVNVSTSAIDVVSGTTFVTAIPVPNPQGTPAFDPGTNTLYVADVVDNTVTELSGSSIVAHVPVGTDPGGQMAVDPVTHIAYVANEGSNTVSEIRGSSVIATVPVGSEPTSVTLNPVTHIADVTNFGSDTVSEISGSSVFATVSACHEPLASALDSASGDVFVTCFGAQAIVQIADTQKMSTTAVGRHPSAITIDPDHQVAYVTNQADNTVSEVSLPPAKPRAWGYVTVRSGVITAQGNSQGQPDDLTQTGTGTYQITMHALATKGVNGGTVDVTGVDQNTPGHSGYCNVVDWFPDGGKLQINVSCDKPTGAPAPLSAFTVVFADPPDAGGPAQYAYVWANSPTSSGYTPATFYQYNSAGRLNTVTRVGTGDYDVLFPGLALANGTVDVTAYGTDAECRVGFWGGSEANVDCMTPAGVPTDARFTATWVAGASLLGIPGRSFGSLWANQPAATTSYTPSTTYSFNSAGGPITVTPIATGQYQVQFGGLGLSNAGTVQVSAYGSADRCAWGGELQSVGTSEVASVFCYTPSEAPVDTFFTFQYLR